MGKSIEEQRNLIRKQKDKVKRVQNNRYYLDSMFVRGVYKLYYKNKVVYVGMSKTNVISRITQHYTDHSKIFDSFSFKSYDQFSDKELEQYEADLIKKLRPKYNKIHNNNNNLKPKNIKLQKPKPSRFKSKITSVKYAETTDGKKILSNRKSNN